MIRIEHNVPGRQHVRGIDQRAGADIRSAGKIYKHFDVDAPRVIAGIRNERQRRKAFAWDQ